ARAVLDITRRRQLLLQQVHDEPCLLAVKTARITTPVLLGEERLCPFVMVVPKLVKQIPGETSSRFYQFGVCCWLNTILRQQWTLKVSVFGDDGLMLQERPQP